VPLIFIFALLKILLNFITFFSFLCVFCLFIARHHLKLYLLKEEIVLQWIRNLDRYTHVKLLVSMYKSNQKCVQMKKLLWEWLMIFYFIYQKANLNDQIINEMNLIVLIFMLISLLKIMEFWMNCLNYFWLNLKSNHLTIME